MPTTEAQKQGIAQSYLHLVRTERTPEQHLDLEMAEAFSGLIPPGIRKPRRFYNMADGSLHPARVFARCVADALQAEVDPVAVLRALWLPIQRFIERKSRRRLPRGQDRRLLPR